MNNLTNIKEATFKEIIGGSILFFLVLIIIFLLFKSCMFSSNNKTDKEVNTLSTSSSVNNDKSPTTIDEIAKLNNAIINPNTISQEIYNFETSEIGADGLNFKIGSLSIQSVNYFSEFNAGGNMLKNAIIFETATSYKDLKDFLENKAYIVAYDSKGNEFSGFTSAVYNDKANQKLYMIFDSTDDISTCKYAVIGGLAKNKNRGYGSVIFTIE